ncbi:hypothetical protein KUCAC02_014991 [Chaenocephalus aceratus]|nr:hypothetical protein KUCAC02_014991 [Chaenocephalus aceratus]
MRTSSGASWRPRPRRTWTRRRRRPKTCQDFIGMMLAAATSKTCATTLAYPHEVIRTRLREEGTKYNSFFQTLRTVPREEGYRALYRGLTTHLVRQIPNTAIVISTYELVVYLLNG